MNESLTRYVAGHDDADDHPLTEAARVALGADPTPRIVKMKVDHDGQPTEIPDGEPLSQII